MTYEELQRHASDLQSKISSQTTLYENLMTRADKRVQDAIKALASAEQTDKSENAEYQSARAEYSSAMIDFKKYKDRYEAYKSYENKKYIPGSTIKIGTTIELELMNPPKMAPKTNFVLKLVPDLLGNAKEGYLSVTSAVGRLLLGQHAHTNVDVDSTYGTIKYRIGEIY